MVKFMQVLGYSIFLKMRQQILKLASKRHLPLQCLISIRCLMQSYLTKIITSVKKHILRNGQTEKPRNGSLNGWNQMHPISSERVKFISARIIVLNAMFKELTRRRYLFGAQPSHIQSAIELLSYAAFWRRLPSHFCQTLRKLKRIYKLKIRSGLNIAKYSSGQLT